MSFRVIKFYQMVVAKLKQHRYFPVALFLLLYGFFYFGNKCYTGLTVPGNAYSPFLDNYLDYVSWFRNVLLEGAAFVIRLFGHHTMIHEHGIKLESGRGVRLVYACMGFAIFSFWWAMILAFPQTLRIKVKYLIGGTLLIVLLNMLRIAAVALAFNKWGHTSVDHHMLFNITTYGILMIMLYRWFNLDTGVQAKKV